MPENPSSPPDPSTDPQGLLSDPRGARPADVPASRRAARASRGASEGLASAPRPATPAPPPRPPQPVHGLDGARRPATGTRTATGPTGPGSAPAGTLEDLFTGERRTDEVGIAPPRRSPRRRRVAGWVALGIVLALVGGVAAGGLWVWNSYEPQIRAFLGWEEPKDFEPGMAEGETSITIVEGDTGAPVSQKMYDAGVTKTPTALYDHLVENSIAFTFQPGVFRLQRKMTSEAALAALKDPANHLENTARLNEGWTLERSVEQIAEQMQLPLDQLQAAVADPAAYGVPASSLEGWLFPATYTFDPGATPADVIRRMVDRTIESLDAAGVPVEDRERILTIASIIEREGRTPDFAKVSRVIQNRLDQGMRLQMDSTAQYGYGELHAGSASTSDEAQFDDNPWNTYVIDGLPAGPIANPGDAAIDAAMHPADGPWLYFVTVDLDTGETVFTATYEEHSKAVAQWRAWCQANPNSGC